MTQDNIYVYAHNKQPTTSMGIYLHREYISLIDVDLNIIIIIILEPKSEKSKNI